jgi:hypothetical protein
MGGLWKSRLGVFTLSALLLGFTMVGLAAPAGAVSTNLQPCLNGNACAVRTVVLGVSPPVDEDTATGLALDDCRQLADGLNLAVLSFIVLRFESPVNGNRSILVYRCLVGPVPSS